MRSPAVPSTTVATFLVRFWRESTGEEVRWRGRIEHVQSGTSVAFLELDAMLAFLERFGVEIHFRRLPTPPEN